MGRVFCFTCCCISIWAQTNMTLESQIPLSSFSLTSTQGTAVWGFSDPDHNHYAVMTTDAGTAVFDITDPTAAVEVGMVAALNSNPQKDVQVYVFDDTPGSFTAYAYVSHAGSGGGLQIIDLSSVPLSIAEVTPNWCPGFTGFTEAHGVSLGLKPTGFIGYVVGSNLASGGVFVLDISNPAGPCDLGSWSGVFVFDLFLSSNWSDPSYDGTELGIAFAGNSFHVIDFSDFYDGDPMTNDATTIPGYTPPAGLQDVRSGWVDVDGHYLIVSDEGDEPLGNPTRVHVFDLSDMTNPLLVETWTGPTNAIDHQVAIWENYAFIANASRGMTLLDANDPTNLTGHAHYDTFPTHDNPTLNGAWESYFFNSSGILACSDRDGGLFLLDPVLPRDVCRALDLNQNGFDIGDLAIRYPNWPATETVIDLIATITTCL